jgi:Flp pilus assembly protein TadG
MLTHRSHPRDGRSRGRGQVLVIFAGAIVLFMLLLAVVVDVSWYWANNLRVQRAADAAALAGVVWLPSCPNYVAVTCPHGNNAREVALAEAAKNGYTDTTKITTTQDPTNDRRLLVSIGADVNTYFMRVVGITSLPITRNSKADFILPVPMGSPLAYYGVGNFSVNQTTPKTTTYQSASVAPFVSVGGGPWNAPDNAWGSTLYATSSTNNQSQVWRRFSFPAIQGSTIDGPAISFNASVSAGGQNCGVKAEVSWDGGTTWGDLPQTQSGLTTTPTTYTLPSASAPSPGSWGSNNPSWSTTELNNTNFQVRLTYILGTNCGTLSLNQLSVTVLSHTDTVTTTMVTTAGVNDGATLLATHGAWGAIITKGGDQSNGDAYSPTSSTKTANTYDPGGYDYVVKLPAGGVVKVFDPGFCAMGGNGAGGSMGAGDHWIGTSGTPVSTYYTLWDTMGKPGLRTAWTEVYTSGSLFQGEKGYDPANMGPNGTGSAPGGATSGCNGTLTDPLGNGPDTYHNAWWTMPSGNLPAGTYAVQIQTTKTAHNGVSADSAQNQSTNAENMFALEAVGGADGSGNSPQIYGNGKMVAYNNLLGGTPPPTQTFYLAQIDRATGAGKTALIDLWDIGDISGTGTLRILSPDGGSQNYVNFTYTTDSSCVSVTGAMNCYSSGTASPPVSSIVTTVSGAQATNGTWIHIRVPLPSTYGTTLWNNGWWQVEYTVTQGGNDTTTWRVSVAGNPVHLVVP